MVEPESLGVQALVELIRAAPQDEPSGLPPEVLGVAREALQSIEVLVGRATALRAAAVHAAALDTPGGTGCDEVVDEISMALVRSVRSARRLRDDALDLTSEPAVWAALYRGDLDAARATTLARALLLVPRHDEEGRARPEFADEHSRILSEGLAYAPSHTPAQLDRRLRQLLAQLDPAASARRRRRAMAERGVWLAHCGDGTAELSARLASEDAERVYAAIRALAMATAREGDGADHERRPFDLAMADALVDLVLPVDGQGRGASVGASVNVTIPVTSLAGLSEDPACTPGLGVIPADVARRLAAGDARWRAVVTHRQTGAVLDVGRWTYRPTAALDRLVRLRDGTCRFPGCAVPATECDLDHLVPFPTGPTSQENLHALCRRHHRLKHEGTWTVRTRPDGGLQWTSPQGSTRTSLPQTGSPTHPAGAAA